MRKPRATSPWYWTIVGTLTTALILTILVVNVSDTTAAEPCTTSGSSIVVSDKVEYESNETAIISGEGFDCGVLLTVKVTRPDGSVVKGDGSGTPGSDNVTIDSKGTFTYNYQIDGTDGLYRVEVLDSSSLVLTAGQFEALSHFRYGTLSWSPTGNPREVEFRFRAAFRRSAYGFPGRCILRITKLP